MKKLSFTHIQSRFDHYIFHAFDASLPGLPIYRILFALIMLVMTRSQHYSWMAPFPDTFFAPPIGLTMFFQGFPPGIVFYAFDFLVLFANICLLIGYRTRTASIAFALLMILGNAWIFSFGKINHTILTILVPLVLSASGWGDRLSIDARRRQGPPPERSSWPLALLALLVGLGMLSAAIAKVATGWLDFQTQAVQGHLVSSYFGEGRQMLLADFLLAIPSPLLWELFDIGTVLFEGLFIFAVFSRYSMRVFCAMACLFHASIFFIMGIGFWANLFAYAAFFDSSWLLRVPPIRAFAQFASSWAGRVRGVHIAGVSALVFCFYTFIGNPVHETLFFIFGEVGGPMSTFLVSLAAILGTGFLGRSVLQMMSSPAFRFGNKSRDAATSHQHHS